MPQMRGNSPFELGRSYGLQQRGLPFVFLTNFPPQTPEDLKGRVVAGTISDRLNTGTSLTDVLGRELKDPVFLEGGFNFPRGGQDAQAGYGFQAQPDLWMPLEFPAEAPVIASVSPALTASSTSLRMAICDRLEPTSSCKSVARRIRIRSSLSNCATR